MFEEILQGTLAGVGGHAAVQTLEGATHTPSHEHSLCDMLEEQNRLLEDILHTLETPYSPPHNIPVNLSTQSAFTPKEVFGYDPLLYKHLCIFFPVSTPLQVRAAYCPTASKTVGPGWVQVDLWDAEYSVSDNNTYPVLFSYREDAIGSSL